MERNNQAIYWCVQSYVFCNWTRTQNRLVRKRTLNHLDSLAKRLSVRLRTKWFLVRVQLQSLHLQISCLLWARSSLTIWQLFNHIAGSRLSTEKAGVYSKEKDKTKKKRMWIHSETCTWHDKIIQPCFLMSWFCMWQIKLTFMQCNMVKVTWTFWRIKLGLLLQFYFSNGIAKFHIEIFIGQMHVIHTMKQSHVQWTEIDFERYFQIDTFQKHYPLLWKIRHKTFY